jgi:hypothetical protein
VAIIDKIRALAPVAAPLLEQQPPQPQQSWMMDLINKRAGSERIKRAPVGFDFKREPFDPSSYYRALGTFRDISRAATAVTQTEVANRENAERERQMEADRRAAEAAGGNVDPRFLYSEDGTDYSGKSRKYHLGHVSKNVSNAADYFGSKFGISNIGGYRAHGSVPGSDHPHGRALDFMTSNKARGTALANDVLRNYKKWNVKYVIWYRYIWSPGRGWRKYNGPSAHTDHVHVSFNK